MAIAVEMYFDPEGEAAVRALWEVLAGAGVPSPMLEAGCRPHVPLAVADAVAVDPLRADLLAFVAEMPPVSLRLSSVGTFPVGEGIVYLGVVPTRELMALHAELYSLFSAHAIHASRHYEPEQWVPHCTIAFGLERAQLLAAVELCLGAELPLDVRIERVGLTEVSLGWSRELASYACPGWPAEGGPGPSTEGLMTESKPSGRIVWTDLTVLDAVRIRDFYASVVGWRAEPVGMGAYSDFNMLSPVSGEPVAGVCHARGANANLPPQWLVYITVSDLAGSIRRCEQLGGTLIDGPRSMGEKSFCVIQDPAGAVAGLIEG